MIIGPLAFAVLVWGSLAAVVVVFAQLLRVVLREARLETDSADRDPETES